MALCRLLLACALLSSVGCDDYGFALAITAESDSAVDPRLIDKFELQISGNTDSDTETTTVPLAGKAKRDERILWKPNVPGPLMENVIVTAFDMNGNVLERGAMGVKMPAGKTTYVPIQLIAGTLTDMGMDAAVDAGVDMVPVAVPPAAADAGYTELTFDSTKLGSAAGEWQDFTFFSQMPRAGQSVQNDGGSITLTGLQKTSYGITTARQLDMAAGYWVGEAFGGGGYFEVTLSFPGSSDGGTGPEFWAFDIEHLSGQRSETTGANWVDFLPLVNESSASTWEPQMNNSWNAGAGNMNSRPTLAPATLPDGGTFAEPHTYAFLWKPATSTSDGSLSFYVDDVKVAGPVTWQLFTDAQAFPPTGADVLNVLDTLHVVPMIGTPSAFMPVTVTAARIWQGAAHDNIKHGTAP